MSTTPIRRGTAQRLGLRPPDGSGIRPRPIDFGVFADLTDETERWRQRLNSMLEGRLTGPSLTTRERDAR